MLIQRKADFFISFSSGCFYRSFFKIICSTTGKSYLAGEGAEEGGAESKYHTEVSSAIGKQEDQDSSAARKRE